MALITPSDWRISFQLNRAGTVYGAGDQVPVMDESEAEALRQQGQLLHASETRLAPEVERLLAFSADDDLLHELRAVVGRPWPEPALVQAVLDAAAVAGRSTTLTEALKLALRQPRTA